MRLCPPYEFLRRRGANARSTGPEMTSGGVTQMCMPHQRNLPVVPLCRGLLQLISPPNQWLPSLVSFPHRGAARDRHGRWERDAMDAHRRAQSLRGRTVFVRTAKSCGPGAPMQALSERNDPQTVATKQWSPGRSRISRKTIAQGRPDDPPVPVVLPRAFCCTRTMGGVRV